MENEKEQQAHEALKTLSLIKKGLKVLAFIVLIGVFGACVVVIQQQEKTITQLNKEVDELQEKIDSQDTRISKLIEEVDRFMEKK